MSRRGWLAAGAFGLVASVLYFASAADYAFPGVCARLMAVWKGLEAAGPADFPLMSAFGRLFGSGNLIAPVCGVVAVVTFFRLMASFVAFCVGEERPAPERERISLVAAGAATLVFLLTPAVRSAATHVEPRLFDFTWALLAVALVFPFVRLKKGAPWLFPLALGAMAALGFCDTAAFALLVPFFVLLVVRVAARAGRRPATPVFLLLASSVLTFFVATACFGLSGADVVLRAVGEMSGYTGSYGWVYVVVFAILPFVSAVFSGGRDFRDGSGGAAPALFHLAMTFVVVLAVATPLSPSALMEPYGVLPVLSSGFAAAAVGYLVAYWWAGRLGRTGLAVGAVFAALLAVALVRNALSFDGTAGSFADKVAHKVLEELGGRRWLVTDGAIDDHLKLAAAAAGKDVNLVCLAKDADADAVARLSALVEREGLGGPKNRELRLSLSLGVRPFLQDWISADVSARTNVAVFGESGLWVDAGVTPVPGFFLFGADESAEPDWSVWREFDAILCAPEGWGSYRGRRTANPVERLRLSLRRYLGFVANGRGIYLQGRKDDDGAFGMYELVFDEIDRDNVYAMLNARALAERGNPRAVARKSDLERMLGSAAEAVGDSVARSMVRRTLADTGDARQEPAGRTTLAMRSGDLIAAKERLKARTESEPNDLRAWSLLAAVMMQQAKTSADERERAALFGEVENRVLPAMERCAGGRFDYLFQMTRGFLLLNRRPDGRRQARDAFALAAKLRPDAAATLDMVLGLDISLDDRESAEQHARDVLRRNRNAPLANYVMGSLALGQGRDEEAELFLRKAADARHPVVFALNDLAEVLRRAKRLDEAERYARSAVERAPGLPVAWDTLGTVLRDAGRDLAEAEACIRKACELSKGCPTSTGADLNKSQATFAE